MQQTQLFEYAVVRIVPKVEREEFLNVGVILYCAKQNFLQTLYTLHEERLQIFCTQVDKQELLQNLQRQHRQRGGNGRRFSWDQGCAITQGECHRWVRVL